MIKSFGAILAAVSCAALLTACAGGGGGGGGGSLTSGPTAPSGPLTPATPYSPGAAPASTHPTGCISAVCMTGSTPFFGPSTEIAVTSAGATTAIDNGSVSVNVTVNPGVTAATTDDIYTVSYNLHGVAYTQAFANPTAKTDALGNLSGTQSIQGGLIANFALFNVASALSGSLDYVQIAAYDRQTLAGAGAEDAFIVYGRQTAVADMPTSGTATYKGGTRGLYITTAGETFQTASDLTLSANFGTGAVSGSTANFRVINSAGTLTARNEDLNLSFNANIGAGSARFSGAAASTLSTAAGGLGLTGTVEGTFYGAAGQAPDEAGLVYKLGTPISGNFMLGGAALGKQ
ncbi:MAG TPA: transferrin-binding protein-like solute binding protein [Asticcacaulis sp.]|nr:transferrin-binding protein-like solute binding protein [Asticcacaulis sp.]